MAQICLTSSLIKFQVCVQIIHTFRFCGAKFSFPKMSAYIKAMKFSFCFAVFLFSWVASVGSVLNIYAVFFSNIHTCTKKIDANLIEVDRKLVRDHPRFLSGCFSGYVAELFAYFDS